MLNFLDKQVMSKPIEVADVGKLKTARQEFRDLQRKSAIEQAKRDALLPDGTLDQTKLRSTLIEKGFGENLDDVVNYIAKEREAAAQLVSEGKRRDMMDIALGLSTPEKVEEYRNGKTTVTTNPVYPGKPSGVTGDYDLTKDPDIPGYIPQTGSPEKKVGENEILVKGSVSTSDGMKLQDNIPQQEYTRTTGSPQISPQYLSSDVDWSKFVPGASSEEQSRENTQYQLPSDKKERELAIKTASIVFGIDFDPNNPNVGQQIDNAATLRAESEVKPVIQQAYKDPFEYLKDKAARPSEVAKKRAEYLSKFEAGRSSLIGQDLQRRSTETGERGQATSQAKTEQEMAPLSPKTNPAIYRDVNSAELSKIEDGNKAIVNYTNAGRSFEDAVDAAIAKSKLDGSVNWDNVVANLVAMGAFPSVDAAKIKLALDPNAPISKEVITNLFKGQTPVLKYNPRGASKEWITKNVKEVNSNLFTSGGRTIAVDNTGLPLYNQDGGLVYNRTASEQLKGKAGEKKEPAKKTPKTYSRGTVD